MNETLLVLAALVFFGATAAKDGGFFPDWLRIIRLVSAVVFALNALVTLL